MTLSTHMWVLDPVDIEQLWPVGRALIHHYSEREGEAVWSDEPVDRRWYTGAPDGSRTRMHTMGQGFCSMYIVEYVEGGGLRGNGVVVHDEDCEDPCEYGHPRDAFPYYASINLDTGYGYSGLSCGDLHARIVGSIGSWLDSEGIRWCWENEFTGEIHQGSEGLSGLGRGAAEASAWFTGTALPAILADLAGRPR